MATDYTMTELVESLKRRGLIPIADKTFDSRALINIMSEELMNFIVPRLMQVRENFFMEYWDQTLEAERARYDIHPRSIGMKIKSMYWIKDSNSTPALLQQVDVEQIQYIPDDILTNVPNYFYFNDVYVNVLPKPKSGIQGTIRQYFFQRRNRLVPVSEAGRITQITSNSVVINAVPTGFDQTQFYDFVKGIPGFQCLEIDVQPTGISGTTFTFSSLPEDLAVGDWLCLAGESPIPQIPLEAFPLLAQQGLYVVLDALNDTSGADKAKVKRDELLSQIVTLVGVRSEDNTLALVSNQNIGNYVFGNVGGYPWLR